MTLRTRALLSACVAMLVVQSPRFVRAAERACTVIAVEAEGRLRQRFPDLLEQIQSELTTRADIDVCARVELRLLDEAVIGVSVTLPDGRSASRSVARREDVVPMLEALLLVPDAASAPAASSAPPVTRHAPPVASVDRSGGRADRDASSRWAGGQSKSHTLGFELSVVGGARVGDGQFGYGAGVLSFLELSRWLIGFQGRADGYRSLQGSDPETMLELAVLAGRRMELGSMALDVTAGPGIALEGVGFSETQAVQMSGTMMAASSRPVEPRSGTMPRLLVGARLGFSPHSVFRTFVGVDGELGPASTPNSADPNLSATHIPAYVVGLALGATVGTP